MNVARQSVEVAGRLVHYRLGGPVDGQPVILLHGASFSAATWCEVGTLTALSEAGYRPFAVDLPGYGESPANNAEPGPWLSQLLHNLDVDRPALIAPSMSGRYALALAASEPERIGALIAVAPVAIKEHADGLTRLQAPTLAIWGADDDIVPHDLQDILVQSLPNARKVIVADAGHAPYMNDTNAFNREVLAFLGEVFGP